MRGGGGGEERCTQPISIGYHKSPGVTCSFFFFKSSQTLPKYQNAPPPSPQHHQKLVAEIAPLPFRSFRWPVKCRMENITSSSPSLRTNYPHSSPPQRCGTSSEPHHLQKRRR
ncbi:hypothetical protein Tb10.70.2870 [Trypanosoma brucei brucei TREU927]|uniref:Uncharacterized protein n=1 Tax=Trypanosoma brucei brucei (strain 927/4 GUTat10.1) TaxID=185431 RepID=Q38BG4_TRYB2|nr:hypothetical protein Tb10.70.2870 [Trypanosoma brucei brucei TREU927]EAN77856.1 hypothetical protein Tb10.70.2870 [Trypanosoma brucei brucei TREU927]